MPAPSPDLPPKLLCYEQLLDAATPQLSSFAWPELDENTPCGLCYTSGTTGNPKVGFPASKQCRFLPVRAWLQACLRG